MAEISTSYKTFDPRIIIQLLLHHFAQIPLFESKCEIDLKSFVTLFSTILTASALANNLNIKNIILFVTKAQLNL